MMNTFFFLRHKRMLWLNLHHQMWYSRSFSFIVQHCHSLGCGCPQYVLYSVIFLLASSIRQKNLNNSSYGFSSPFFFFFYIFMFSNDVLLLPFDSQRVRHTLWFCCHWGETKKKRKNDDTEGIERLSAYAFLSSLMLFFCLDRCEMTKRL